MPNATMTEPAFIAALRALAQDPAARGLDDDVAVIDLGGESLILTHDMMVEGIHWLPEQDPADVAWKLVATNLSDLAAKGAQPLGVLLGYGLGGGEARFLAGLEEVLRAFAVPLLGGDTVRRGASATHGLTALGRATHRPVPSRKGARAGDTLWVTGTLGAAMLGFEALKEGQKGSESPEIAAFTRPVPRLAEGRALAPHVTAMMDVSDGLLLDATRLARASGITLAVDSSACPFPASLSPERRRAALSWGDDYELLFTLPAGQAPPVPAACIGKALPPGPAPLLLDGQAPAGVLGYEHG